MTGEEQDLFLSRGYFEAIRYMDNAKETLQKAKKTMMVIIPTKNMFVPPVARHTTEF